MSVSVLFLKTNPVDMDLTFSCCSTVWSCSSVIWPSSDTALMFLGNPAPAFSQRFLRKRDRCGWNPSALSEHLLHPRSGWVPGSPRPSTSSVLLFLQTCWFLHLMGQTEGVAAVSKYVLLSQFLMSLLLRNHCVEILILLTCFSHWFPVGVLWYLNGVCDYSGRRWRLLFQNLFQQIVKFKVHPVSPRQAAEQKDSYINSRSNSALKRNNIYTSDQNLQLSLETAQIHIFHC